MILIALVLLVFAPSNLRASYSPLWKQEARVTSADKKKLSDEDDIREAVFRHQFEHYGRYIQKSAEAFYLCLGGATLKELLDVSDEFLERFKERKPPVRKCSKAVGHAVDGVTDKETGKKGLLFQVADITWLSENEAEAEGGYYENGLSASWSVYTLKREGGKWVVKSEKKVWVS